MTRKTMIAAAQAATVLAVIPVILYGNLSGPPPGSSGAMGEQNCAECHNSGGNAGGMLTVNLPDGLFYMPGQTQHWKVTISDLAGRSWGFQLTTRMSGTTTQAGTLISTDTNTHVLCANGIDPNAATAPKAQFLTAGMPGTCPTGYNWQWIEQTWNPNNPIGPPEIGAQFGSLGPVSWTFDWTPPSSSAGNIDVNIAAVAGAGIDSTAGGNVYIQHYVLSVPAPNQPAITAGGVVNNASGQPTIGPNTWVTIYGTNLANTTAAWGRPDFVGGRLPTALQGVSVTIAGVPTYVEYVSPTQVNVLTPATLPLGSNLNVQLVNNSLSSFPGAATAQMEAPGLFEWPNHNAVATYTDFSYAGPAGLFSGTTTKPAKAGDTIILWATGLGTTTPPLPDGKLPNGTTIYNVIHQPSVTVGGQGAQLVYAVLSPQFAGVYQVAFVVPGGLSNGPQPVVLSAGSYSSPPSGVNLEIGN